MSDLSEVTDPIRIGALTEAYISRWLIVVYSITVCNVKRTVAN